MATRLLPFRQYDENDVVNLYSFDGTPLDMSTTGPQTSSTADAGVLVKVTAGDLTKDAVELHNNATVLGWQGAPHLGKNQYPIVPWQVQAAGSGEAVLGITLKQTVSHDENGEKLLYYPQKKDELQAVLSGEAVPIATRGLFMIDDRAFSEGDATHPAVIAVGTKLSCHANGKFGPWTSGTTTQTDNPVDDVAVGTIMGNGTRSGEADGTTSNYYLVNLNPSAA